MIKLLQIWVAALWWGSLTTIGFMVVPLLFVYLPTPAVAGNMAAKLFFAQTWVSTASTLLLLIVFKKFDNTQTNNPNSRRAVVFISTGFILALLSEFWISPRIVLRENLSFWHTTGSVMYFLQWLCASMSLGKLICMDQKKFGPDRY